MKTPFSIAVWTVLASIVVKMLVYLTNNQFTDIGRYAIFLNILFIMSAVFLSIREFKKSRGATSDYIEDFKIGMKAAAWYAILLSVFVYTYYSYIDSSYFPTLMESRMELAKEAGVDVKQAKDTAVVVLNPFFQSTITLVGFLLMGAFYSALISYFVRKMKGFGH